MLHAFACCVVLCRAVPWLAPVILCSPVLSAMPRILLYWMGYGLYCHWRYVLYCIVLHVLQCCHLCCTFRDVLDCSDCSLLFCTVLFCTVLSALLGCNAEIPSQTTGGKCCPHCCTIPLLHYRHCATCSSEVLHCVLYCTVLYCTVLSGRCFHVAGGWRGRRNLVLYFLYMHGDTKPDSKRPRTVSIAPSSRTCG